MSLERHGSRLDPWVDAYAVRTRGMTASEVRALFAVASRPEVVSLAGGMPYVAALPLEAVADAVARMLVERGTRALQYGSGQGDEWLRELIASEVLPTVGVHSHPDDVIVTVGSQQALDLITRVFVDPGDVILVEAPSYVTALSTFAAYQADVVHVAMDEQGLLPDALADAIDAVARAGKRAKFVYTIPSYHNPAGVTQGPERRREVLAVAQRAGLLLVEDDPYGLLGFDGVIPRAIRADEEDGVIYVGSFSKTFAPGLRVGFAVAPHGVREKLVLAAEASVLCPPAYSQLTVATYLATQPWLDQVKAFRELYRERRDALLESLERAHARGDHLDPAGGGFLLLGHASRRAGRERDAAPGGHGSGGLRPRHRLLLRLGKDRSGGAVLHAAVVLLPGAGADPGGRAPAGRRRRAGARPRLDLRTDGRQR